MFYSNTARTAVFAPARPSFLTRLNVWINLAAERRQLASLTEEQRFDLGLTKNDVTEEANRPFWDVPATWRQGC